MTKCYQKLIEMGIKPRQTEMGNAFPLYTMVHHVYDHLGSVHLWEEDAAGNDVHLYLHSPKYLILVHALLVLINDIFVKSTVATPVLWMLHELAYVLTAGEHVMRTKAVSSMFQTLRRGIVVPGEMKEAAEEKLQQMPERLYHGSLYDDVEDTKWMNEALERAVGDEDDWNAVKYSNFVMNINDCPLFPTLLGFIATAINREICPNLGAKDWQCMVFVPMAKKIAWDSIIKHGNAAFAAAVTALDDACNNHEATRFQSQEIGLDMSSGWNVETLWQDSGVTRAFPGLASRFQETVMRSGRNLWPWKRVLQSKVFFKPEHLDLIHAKANN